jgi:hypothetical protein
MDNTFLKVACPNKLWGRAQNCSTTNFSISEHLTPFHPPLPFCQAFNIKFNLSSSQTPVRTTDRWRLECSSVCGGFGTVTDDGYGVSYLVYDDCGENRAQYTVWLYTLIEVFTLPVRNK